MLFPSIVTVFLNEGLILLFPSIVTVFLNEGLILLFPSIVTVFLNEDLILCDAFPSHIITVTTTSATLEPRDWDTPYNTIER